jgi:phosphatidylglycerol---prolipoprotein diacylglyceryl transferase
MTFPIDIVVAGVTIPSHLLFDILSMYVGFTYFSYLNKKNHDPISTEHRWLVILGGVMGALIGSRLLAALERPELFFNPPSVLYYYAHKTILGGIAGAILGVEIIKKIIGQKKRTGDAFTYPLILGIIIGRIGCFLSGVQDGTVGVASNLPWAFDQGDGIARHPTALYEIIFLLIVWLMLYMMQKKIILQQGVLFRLFIIAYTVFRFFVEYIKPVHPIALGLSSIQIVSAIIALYYLLSLVIHRLYRPIKIAKVQ